MVLTVALATCAAAATPKRLALLIGIGQYADKRIPTLEGPAHDIEAMQAALREHWGFAAADITVLRDRAATREAILGAIEQLERASASGDQLFIYFSGHGTSAGDRTLSLPLPHSSGAFVPHVVRVDGTKAEIAAGLIVGARDLRPRLARLDAGGRQVLVVSDSCYSGQAVRMLGALPGGVRLRPRHLSIEALSGNTDAAGATATTTTRSATRSSASAARPEPEPYPYRHIFYIAAASDSEPAMDIGSDSLAKLPTLDNRPHGALTDALLRALTGRLPDIDANRDGAVDHGEIFAAVQRFMAMRAYPHTPQALPPARDDTTRLARARVFDAAPPDVRPSGAAATAQLTSPPSAATRPLRVRLADLREPPVELRDLAGVRWLSASAAIPTAPKRTSSSKRKRCRGGCARRPATSCCKRAAMPWRTCAAVSSPPRGCASCRPRPTTRSASAWRWTCTRCRPRAAARSSKARRSRSRCAPSVKRSCWCSSSMPRAASRRCTR
ncbi:MAG: caspase family protein [Rubrivivax sp.]